MNMKKTWTALALTAIITLPAACGADTNPKTPKEAAEAYLEAIGTMDAESIIKLTAGYADMTADELQSAMEDARKAAKDVAPVQKDIIRRILKEASVAEVKEKGDEAIVTLKDQVKSIDLKIRKEKDGTWRVVAPL